MYWPYEVPCWVFTARQLPQVDGDVRFVRGPVAGVQLTLVTAADHKDVWVVGGDELAAQFADAVARRVLGAVRAGDARRRQPVAVSAPRIPTRRGAPPSENGMSFKTYPGVLSRRRWRRLRNARNLPTDLDSR